MATRQLDGDIQPVISVLTDQTKSAQEKYDLLYDKFYQMKGTTRLEALVGLYSGGNETFETRNSDESRTYQNLGKAIRKYVKLFTEQEKSNDIAYEYVPGPFMRVYVKARKNSNKPFLLIIEEINRANVAAVFGDVFQLLDRDDSGESEYPIEASEDIKNYLAKELGGKPEDYSKIYIPNNMFIWATMNSADQGVFPMDTAFKRRWDFTYIGIDKSDEDIRDKYVCLGKDANQKIKWNALRKAINNFLAKEKINEDKQLGPYFISKSIIVPLNGDEIDRDKFIDAFKNKVIMYLFEDAARQKRSTLFAGCSECSNRYSEICQKFDDIGIDIFNQEIRDETKSTKPEPSDLNQTNVDSNE